MVSFVVRDLYALSDRLTLPRTGAARSKGVLTTARQRGHRQAKPALKPGAARGRESQRNRDPPRLLQHLHLDVTERDFVALGLEADVATAQSHSGQFIHDAVVHGE